MSAILKILGSGLAHQFHHPSKLLFRRVGHFAGRTISDTQYDQTKATICDISQKYLSKITLSSGPWYHASPSTPVQVGNPDTGQLWAWRTREVIAPLVDNQGNASLINHDKLVTLVQAAALVDMPTSNAERILLVDEGCDNGDILFFALPILIDSGKPISVILTNGNETKLNTASQLANWILDTKMQPEKIVQSVVHNAFTGPKITGPSHADLQKIFMLYHLGIVERPERIARMIRKRTSSMGPKDVGLITFFDRDADCEENFANRPGYECIHSTTSNSITFRKPVTRKTAQTLKDLGLKDPDDFYNYLTAFDCESACEIMEMSGARIVHGSKIEANTDQGKKAGFLGMVFQKA